MRSDWLDWAEQPQAAVRTLPVPLPGRRCLGAAPATYRTKRDVELFLAATRADWGLTRFDGHPPSGAKPGRMSIMEKRIL
jgi:hypothetical protein